MKALILSGGHGTRLRPITYTSAKQLVPVANKPVLFYGIEAMKAAGITEIGIIVGPTAEEIKAAVGDGSRWEVKITYIPQDYPRGLAHAVLIAEDFLGKDRFVMYLGDNLVLGGINEFVNEYKKSKANSQILLSKVPNPSSYGIAEVQGNKIIRLEEKPKAPKSDLAVVGVYLFDENVFKACKAIKPSARGELEITHAIQWLIDNNYDVKATQITGWWKDTGRLEDMLQANRIVLDTYVEEKIEGSVDASSQIESRVQIEEGAVIKNSKIRGPTIIGKNAQILNSYIGPYSSISEGVTIDSCELEHSIILNDSNISHVGRRIHDSLIGKGVKIGRSKGTPTGFQFMIGDNSEVSIP